MYDVKVYQEGVGELVVAETDVEDSADPDMIRLVVYCHKPGT
jgi:hypothetical protein